MSQIVLKLGGSVCLDPAQVQVVAAEIKALQAKGHRVVVVHGGGPQLDKALAALGETVQKVDGLRVTSKPAADVVRQVMDEIGNDLTAALSQAGVAAAHLRTDTRSFEATPKRSDKGDLGRVGTVKRFTGKSMLDETTAKVPVVTPVGFDAQGPLNVNADEGACAVATSLRSDWLVLATDVAAVRGAAGESLARMSPRAARKLIADGAAQGGMVPKLSAAVHALSAGVGHVLVCRIEPGVLASAIILGKPVGTLIEDDMQVMS